MEEQIAITISSGRISPVFDVACTASVLSGDTSTVLATIPLPLTLAERAELLARQGVTRLVCGAISRPARCLLEGYGIRVIGFVAGEADEIIAALRDNRLPDVRFAMPGCRQCCGRGRRRHGWSNPAP